MGGFKELLHQHTPPTLGGCLGGGWSGVLPSRGRIVGHRLPTGDSSLPLPCHKTHFLLVLGITRCDVGTKDNTGDEEPVTCFDASIPPPAADVRASGLQRGDHTTRSFVHISILVSLASCHAFTKVSRHDLAKKNHPSNISFGR